MQGRARGRKGERKTHHITSYHHITMKFGGYLVNVAKNPTRARARKGDAQGVLSYQKVTGIFDNPHVIFCGRRNIWWRVSPVAPRNVNDVAYVRNVAPGLKNDIPKYEKRLLKTAESEA